MIAARSGGSARLTPRRVPVRLPECLADCFQHHHAVPMSERLSQPANTGINERTSQRSQHGSLVSIGHWQTEISSTTSFSPTSSNLIPPEDYEEFSGRSTSDLPQSSFWKSFSPCCVAIRIELDTAFEWPGIPPSITASDSGRCKRAVFSGELLSGVSNRG